MTTSGDESNEVVVRCHLPKHLLHHIAGPTVKVRFVEREPRPAAPEQTERREAG